MENTTKQIETVSIPKELHEKIENRHERRNQIIDFIKQAQEKRDDCKNKDTLNKINLNLDMAIFCLLYTSPSPRDRTRSRMPSSA